jgi:hypothetical protein
VEIKESKQDDKVAGVQTFIFDITAEIAPNGPDASGNPQAKPASAPSQGAPSPAPAKKG